MEIKGKTIGTGKPLLCVPVMESNTEEIIDELRTLAKSEADIVEWRIDTFVDYKNYNAVREVFAAAAECMKEKIFLYTFRTKKQGGMGELAPDELNDLHDLAAESGCVDLLDLEFFEEEHPARKIRKLHKQGLKVIASHHDFYETPDREVMKMLLEQMCAGDADIVKLAVMPQNKRDVLTLLSATEEMVTDYADRPIITMSMAGTGVISRLCGEVFGSSMTFGAAKKASAPGQMGVEDLSTVLGLLHKSM